MEESTKPSVYLLIGNDLRAMRLFVKDFIDRMGDASMADLNTTRLDGTKLGERDLAEAVGALPFLTERRLVVLENPLAGIRGESAQKHLLGVLESIPPTTALVMLMEDEIERGAPKAYNEKHWFMRWTGTTKQRVFIKMLWLPAPKNMSEWIMKEAKKMGGTFSTSGAQALTAEIGSNTEQAQHEMEKLLAYVNYQRPVEAEDVLEVTAPGGEWSIFDMVDAMGTGDQRLALKLLHHLLEEQDARSLFGMIARQFRLLILVRELLDEGRLSAETGYQVGIKSAWQLEKLTNQARGWHMNALETVYHRLLEMDEQFKSSQMEPSIALDVFIAELSPRP